MMADDLIFEPEIIESLIERQEFSAETWAREFMLAALRTPEMTKDSETMLCWFAGALMSGFARGAASLDDSAFPVEGPGGAWNR